MKKNDKRSSHITLHYPGGEPLEVDVRNIHSLVSLSPFVTDLLLTNGGVETVEGSLFEVVSSINESAFPIFKSMDGFAHSLTKLSNLNYYRTMNYGTDHN